MPEGGHEPNEHLGGGFEHGLELGFLHPLDVLAQMADRILQPFAHFAHMVQGLRWGGPR
jgi:hypothetical protein